MGDDVSGYWYVLDPDHEVVPVASSSDYFAWLHRVRQSGPSATLQVTYDFVGTRPDTISTVFLGRDHSFGTGPLQVFETMLFTDDERDQSFWRYATWDESVAGHQAIVAALREGSPVPA